MARRPKAGGGTDRRSPFVVVLIAASVVAIGVVGYALTSNDAGGGQMATRPVEVDGLEDPLRRNEVLQRLAQPLVLGDPNAPIRIIEFADYQCPGCRFFQQSVKNRVQMAYVDGGIAQFVFYDFPLVQIHPHAFLAARAARCANDQGRYFDYHDALFINQSSWSVSASPARHFIEYGATLGLDSGAFEGCLRSERHADVVTANLRLAVEMGLNSTPSILVQGPEGPPRSLGAVPLEEIYDLVVRNVEELRQQAGA